jgi:hypothetical protein
MRTIHLVAAFFVGLIQPAEVLAISQPLPTPSPQPAAIEAPGRLPITKNETLIGTVHVVNQQGNTVVVTRKTDDEEKTAGFVLTEKTKITRGGSIRTLRDVKKGMEISVTYTRDENLRRALAIELLD